MKGESVKGDLVDTVKPGFDISLLQQCIALVAQFGNIAVSNNALYFQYRVGMHTECLEPEAKQQFCITRFTGHFTAH